MRQERAGARGQQGRGRRHGHLQLRLRQDRGSGPQPGPDGPDADDLARQHQPWPDQGLGPGRARQVLPDRHAQLRPRHRHRRLPGHRPAHSSPTRTSGPRTATCSTTRRPTAQGVAKAFADEAKKQGIEIVGNEAWDAKQPNYTALFERLKAKNPDCVYLGGINDNNGGQLVKDKVKVLGPNIGAVKLIGPDGFTGYPACRSCRRPRACTSRSPVCRRRAASRQGGAGAKFVTTSRPSTAHDPASAYAIYGAAACSDPGGDREVRRHPQGRQRGGVQRQASPSPPTSRSSARSSASTQTGDVTVKDMSIQLMKDNDETFLKAWPLG